MMVLARLALVVLAFSASSCAPPTPPAPLEPRAQNLLFISLDTVRRDHLPIYGYARDTSPALRRLAESAWIFDNVYAQAVSTNPSHASMFTGSYPRVHGSLRNSRLLPRGQITLAQILQRQGFATGAFVSAVTMNRASTALERGFDVYDDAFSESRRHGRLTTQLALRWLAERDPGQRFFLFLHLYDAHGPYEPDPEYRGRFVSSDPGPTLDDIPAYQQTFDSEGKLHRSQNDYLDRYDDQIRFLDDQVGEMLGAVDLSNTLVVILSDHGETLTERHHKFDHGVQLFDEQIRIPLIVRVPNAEPQRISNLVETVDLLPTLLELLGEPIPEDRPVQGQSLVPLLSHDEIDARRYTFASARVDSERHADRGYRLNTRLQIQSIRSERWKLIRYPGLEHHYLELYDLHSDPMEKNNVAEQHPKLVEALQGELVAWWESGSEHRGTEATVDPVILEQMRSLGYVE